MDDPIVWHTYRSAAKLVGRSERTIKNWRSWGMPMSWQIIDGQRTRVVRQDVLQEHFRKHLAADPVHRYRMRRLVSHGAASGICTMPT